MLGYKEKASCNYIAYRVFSILQLRNRNIKDKKHLHKVLWKMHTSLYTFLHVKP